MKKICLALNGHNSDSYAKNCDILHEFLSHKYLNYDYVITSIVHSESDMDSSLREYGDNNLHKICYDKVLDKAEDLAVKHAIITNCDIILFIDDYSSIIDKEKLLEFISNIVLYSHETSIYDIKHLFTVYKINSNGYGLVGIKNGTAIYSGLIPTISGFKQMTVTENEMPFKILT